MSEAHTHMLAAFKHDNGELGEDVVAKKHVFSAGDDAGGWDAVDEESDESFPASDPPSHWSGEQARARPTESDQGHPVDADRIVLASPVEQVPGRPRPDQPVPKTLPRAWC